jgi:chromosome segregation ATPase
MSLLKHCRLTSVGVGEIDLDLKKNDDNMTDSEKLQDLKSQIKELEQKKTTLTDADEIKAINRQINALQEEFGRLRKEIQYRRSFDRSVEREFVHCVVGDE